MPRTIRLNFTETPVVNRSIGYGAHSKWEGERERINVEADEDFEIEAFEIHDLASQRDGGATAAIDLQDDDVVGLELDDEGELWLSAARVQELVGQDGDDLFLASDTPLRQGMDRDRSIGGWIRRLILPKIKDKGIDWASEKVIRAFIEKKESSLYHSKGGLLKCSFRSDGEPPSFQKVTKPLPHTDGPILILVHGFCSSTIGSFTGLWAANDSRNGQPHYDAWLQTIKHLYQDRVYGFDHPTVSQSPVKNACELLELLPANQSIHLLSYSRGGLVGELIARGTAGGPPVTEVDPNLGQVAVIVKMDSSGALWGSPD